MKPYKSSLTGVTAGYPTSVYTPEDIKDPGEYVHFETLSSIASPYLYRLDMLPARFPVPVVTVNGASRVVVPYSPLAPPSTGQVAISFDMPLIEFAADDAAATSFRIDYTGLGAMPIAQVLNQLQVEIAATQTKLDAGAATSWGSITGTLSAQTDLQAALDGKASLVGGKVPTAQLPALALTDVNVVASEAAQLALVVEEGDVAIRTDINKSFIHNGGTAGTMADWSELLSPGTVTSVNGQTGTVSLSAADVGAAAAVHTHAAGDITSGTFSTDRLPTVPVTKGGTGLTALGAANQYLKVNAAGDGLEYGALTSPSLTWGSITGTLSNQADLQAALDGKTSASSTTTSIAGIPFKTWNNTASTGSIAFGYSSTTTIGSYSLAIGQYAGGAGTGTMNTYVGNASGNNLSATSAGGRTFVGYAAGNQSTAAEATYIGKSAGSGANGGSSVMVGYAAGDSPGGLFGNRTTTATNQTLIGHQTGHYNSTQSSHITCVGSSALATGTGSIAIGSGAQARYSDSIALGYNVQTTASNQVSVGTRSVVCGSIASTGTDGLTFKTDAISAGFKITDRSAAPGRQVVFESLYPANTAGSQSVMCLWQKGVSRAHTNNNVSNGFFLFATDPNVETVCQQTGSFQLVQDTTGSNTGRLAFQTQNFGSAPTTLGTIPILFNAGGSATWQIKCEHDGTNHKLGFYGTAPVVRQDPSSSITYYNDGSASAANLEAMINGIYQALINCGLLTGTIGV